MTLHVYAVRIARYNYRLGAELEVYRGQLRAFIAKLELQLWRWRVGVHLNRRYW